MSQSDEILIKEILKGNESAMEILVDRYYNMVHRYIYRSVGEYNIAYDLTQEVFIKMMKNLSKYKDKGMFKQWLLKISVNVCKDYYKSAYYRNTKDSVDIAEKEIESDEKVIDILEKNEKRTLVRKAITNLPQMQREAIILKYYEDLKISEISNLTGDNESTIKSRLFNGIRNLKKMLIGGDEVYEKKSK